VHSDGSSSIAAAAAAAPTDHRFNCSSKLEDLLSKLKPIVLCTYILYTLTHTTPVNSQQTNLCNRPTRAVPTTRAFLQQNYEF
jgi:hypothetical protein